MLALDHRGSIAKMLPASISPDKKTETIVSIKKMLLASLASQYSGVLFDSEYGLAAYNELQSNADVVRKPYLLCIEKTGYTDTNHERLTNLEYTVDQLKEKGAKGVKLLLFFHPEAHTAQAQVELTKKVYADCQAAGLPFFLEILNYSLDELPYDASILVPKSVQIFLDAGITADVYKLEFPGTAEACQRVTSMLGSIPWILLTKGDTYEGFVKSLKIASANGAKGFLAGRSIWQDFANLPQDQWESFFQTTVAKRFEEICGISVKG